MYLHFIKLSSAYKYLLLTLFTLFFVTPLVGQTKVQLPHKKDVTSMHLLAPAKRTGFVASLSLVAMFTSGADDRKGFRLGGGISIGYNLGDWGITTGVDAYKAKQNFGIGTSFAGFNYYDGKWGGSYYLTRYYQGDKQTSAILGVRADDFQLRFEDDILALPFTGFKIYDRYRTAGLELQYKDFLLGTNVYTTDINGVTDMSLKNSLGTYADGRQISSPIYVGYTNRNLIIRTGINHPIGGVIGQNIWHRLFFGTPDFKAGEYKEPFVQFGVNKPYTLY